jgi:hypothetical protein
VAHGKGVIKMSFRSFSEVLPIHGRVALSTLRRNTPVIRSVMT